MNRIYFTNFKNLVDVLSLYVGVKKVTVKRVNNVWVMGVYDE